MPIATISAGKVGTALIEMAGYVFWFEAVGTLLGDEETVQFSMSIFCRPSFWSSFKQNFIELILQKV